MTHNQSFINSTFPCFISFDDWFLYVLATLLLIFSFSSFAQTHCLSSEYVLLSGKFGKLDKNNKFFGEKVLSLCADKKERLSKLDYRFGPIGSIEMQYSSPSDGKFYFTNQQIMPRASVDVIYFTKGKTTYAITDCQGMHCSSSFKLLVFNAKKRIADFVSEPEKLTGEHFDLKNSNVFLEKNITLDFDDK